jgi:hypothetical protein
MTLAALAVACPRCGSTNDVVYSCKPECCFNHVCAKCYTTFELATHKVGEAADDLGPLPPSPDPSGPTAPCARCGECELFVVLDDQTPSGKLVCVSCKALLTIELTQVAAG